MNSAFIDENKQREGFVGGFIIEEYQGTLPAPFTSKEDIEDNKQSFKIAHGYGLDVKTIMDKMAKLSAEMLSSLPLKDDDKEKMN